MNVLMVGGGKAGSWMIRGRQLGAAIGARVTEHPLSADWAWADLAVLVKRSAFVYAAQAQAAGVPIVWDALDFWAQPADNALNERQARTLVQDAIYRIRPVLVIGATAAMADAVGGAVVPHHSWRGLEPSRVSPDARTVVYQGEPQYLGRWADALHAACAARGWTFRVNPDELSSADIIVALRDGRFDGWMCREWKSGVKLGNAIAAGRPVITQPSAAMRELGGPGSVIETPADLDAALDAWTPRAARESALEQCRALAPELRLLAIAERYRAVLAAVEVPCRA